MRLTETEKLSPLQRLLLNLAVTTLKMAFRGENLKGIIEGPLADRACGAKPAWANLPQRKLVDTMPANVGACVMCLFLDGDETMIVIGERPDPAGPAATLYNGSGGGFANLRTCLGAGEQPREAAVREWREENRDADDRPVCELNPARLHMIDTENGVDYRSAQTGGLPTAYTMFYTWLDESQATAVKRHASNMDDKVYREACRRNTGGETAATKVMTLKAAAELPVVRFAHLHEAEAIRRLHTLRGAGSLRP